MSESITKNCKSQEQLEKIIRGQERKFRWRDDWPAMEQALLADGNAAIEKYNRSREIDSSLE